MDVSGTSSTRTPATTSWTRLELPLEWISGTIVNDYDLISKIRARQCTRNHELYTGQWADTRSSRVREQQVVRQKPHRITRALAPYGY